MSAEQKSAYGINGELYGSAKRVPYNLLIIRTATLYLRLADKLKKTPGDLNSRTFAVKGYQDLPVPVELIEPAKERGDLPVLIDIHGGAFSYPASPHHKELAYQYAREVPCLSLIHIFCTAARTKAAAVRTALSSAQPNSSRPSITAANRSPVPGHWPSTGR